MKQKPIFLITLTEDQLENLISILNIEAGIWRNEAEIIRNQLIKAKRKGKPR